MGFSIHCKFAFRPAPENLVMITRKDLIEGGSAAMVMICGGLAGHYAAIGMTPVQWLGAATAVLGSVTVAVAVRLWPAEARAQQD
jgi:type IV secretory pathway TrbD component